MGGLIGAARPSENVTHAILLSGIANVHSSMDSRHKINVAKAAVLFFASRCGDTKETTSLTKSRP